MLQKYLKNLEELVSPPAFNQRQQTTRILLIVAIFGLLSGLLESLIYWFLSVYPDYWGWRNDLLPQILWIAPLFNIFLFFGIFGLSALINIALRSPILVIFGIIFLSLLCFYGPLSASGKIGETSVILLTTGITTQVLFVAFRWRDISNVILGWGLALIISLIILANLVYLGIDNVKKGTIIRTEVEIGTDTPNIILIVIDTLRADHVSSYGYSRSTTRSIDLIAQDGVLFERAYAPASWTLPSHASLFTGRSPYEHKAGARPLDDKYQTLAEALSSIGYATAGFSSNTYYVTPSTGLLRGFDYFRVYYSNIADMVNRTYFGGRLLEKLPLLGFYNIPGRKNAAIVNHEFLNWLTSKPEIPFFAFLNYFDVHDPYLAPSGYKNTYSDQPTRGDKINSELYPRDFTGGRTLSPQEIQAEIDGYDASLVYVDDQIGQLFEELNQLGRLDNTIMIITSDHGESFGNHGLYGHGNSLYTNLLQVPLIIYYPENIPGGVRVTSIVELQSLPATIMDMLDSKSPFPGNSLVPCWSGCIPCGNGLAYSESEPGIVPDTSLPLGRRGAKKSIIKGRWHLILNEEGDYELYRLDQDFKEVNNLAGTSEGKNATREIIFSITKDLTQQDWKLFGHLLDTDYYTDGE